MATLETSTYDVPGVSCAHCRTAIEGELSKLEGVDAVEVDLDAKRVTVTGTRVDDAAVRAAIGDAGYDVADRS